jgi:hypothetical protein
MVVRVPRTTTDRADPAHDAFDNDRSLDTHAAARLLGLSPLGLADLRRKGGGPPFYRVGRRAVRYRLGDLRAWIAARTVGARP